MLVRIGAAPPPTDLVGTLVACHHRIRHFLELAGKIASAQAPPAEIAEAAAQVRRYFSEALPLHVADEEQTLRPLLAGRDAEVDRAFARMERDHHDHEPLLVDLLAQMRAIEEEPTEIPGDLKALVERLARELGDHLAREEAICFPALTRLLSEEERAQAKAAIAARRR